jgi:hypothetical protein
MMSSRRYQVGRIKIWCNTVNPSDVKVSRLLWMVCERALSYFSSTMPDRFLLRRCRICLLEFWGTCRCWLLRHWVSSSLEILPVSPRKLEPFAFRQKKHLFFISWTYRLFPLHWLSLLVGRVITQPKFGRLWLNLKINRLNRVETAIGDKFISLSISDNKSRDLTALYFRKEQPRCKSVQYALL